MQEQNQKDLLQNILQQAIWNFYNAKTISLAATINLADHMTDGINHVDELANKINCHAPTLRRVLRALTTPGLIIQNSSHEFSLTEMGKLLRKDVAYSAHSTLLTLSGPEAYRSVEQMGESLKTGDTSFDLAYGEPLFEHLKKHPDLAALFSETMAGLNSDEQPAVAQAYDFSETGKIVDVGGATGNMLAEILTRHQHTEGILIDLEHVLAEAPSFIKSHNLEERITLKACNFFEFVPAGGDIYILSHILHDWKDADCLSILANCHQAMTDEAKLLIIELLIPEDGSPHPATMLDVGMLIWSGGQERTTTEYQSLLSKAKFKMTRVINTNSNACILEAVKC